MERTGTDPALVVTLPVPPRPRASAETDADRIARLVEAAKRGDLDAWARLYQDTFDTLVRHVCFLTGDAMATEDLVQDAYARAIANLRQYDGRASFVAWLRGIALNVVRMHWRRSRTTSRVHDRLRELSELTAAGTDTSVDRLHHQDARMRLLYEILGTLPENLREAFVLRELEGLAPDEAAAQLGISPGNLAVRASRARAKIRRELERLGWLEELA
ncbi:MAG TPA: RNA polymerase sigma factor [Nannocystaceae bacterium]|nr:RNA polymerase sigma factor [Nannocystaceae bacterium]